jgi:hypothetical protein
MARTPPARPRRKSRQRNTRSQRRKPLLGRKPVASEIDLVAAPLVERQALQCGTLQHFNVMAVFVGDRQDRIGKPYRAFLMSGGKLPASPSHASSNACPMSFKACGPSAVPPREFGATAAVANIGNQCEVAACDPASGGSG